jgi:SAM-dependent methyltransferase
MASVPDCPICQGTSAVAFSSRYHVVVKCSDVRCGHLFVPDPCSGAGIQIHTDPDDEHAKYGARNSKLTSYLVDVGFLRAGDRVLDFGAGSGHLARAVESAAPDVRVLCIEADAAAQRHLRALGLEVAGRLEDAREGHDSAILVEVLEHLDDPVGVLRAIAVRLRPEGRLFFTTPCGETSRGSRRTNAYDTPEHIHFFTARSLAIALLQAGFAPPDLRVVNALYPRVPGLMAAAKGATKDLLRPARARLRGFTHLVGFSHREAT